MSSALSDIEKKYLFGEPTLQMMLEHINREDSSWVSDMARDLAISPQRKGVVVDCIEWKFRELTSVNK